MGAWSNRINTGSQSPAGYADAGVFVNSSVKAELGEEIIRSIGSAGRSISIINPLISDERLIQQILDARSRGVRIKVITELRENRKSGIRYPTKGFAVEDDRSLNEHFNAIRLLAKGRVLCRGMKYCAHAKAVLVDDEHLILGSANGTSNSLGWGSQPSMEAGIKVDEPLVVSHVAKSFGKVWEQCPFRLHLMEQDISLQECAVDLQNEFLVKSEVAEDSQVVWSYPPHGRALRDCLVRLVQHSRNTVVIAAMSFYETDKVECLHQALLEAMKRGVRVTVIVRPDHFRPDQFPDHSTRHLLENGLRLLGVSSLHAKGIVVDENACAIFSGNVNPFSLDCQDASAQVELGLCEFGDAKILRHYAKWLTELEAKADFEYA